MQKPENMPALQKQHNKHRPEMSGESSPTALFHHCEPQNDGSSGGGVGRRAKFIWKIECLLELMDPGGCWILLDSSQRCFTMQSFIKGRGAGRWCQQTHTHTHCTHAHILCVSPGSSASSPFCARKYDLFTWFKMASRSRYVEWKEHFPGTVHTNTEKKKKERNVSFFAALAGTFCWQNRRGTEGKKAQKQSKKKKKLN